MGFFSEIIQGIKTVITTVINAIGVIANGIKEVANVITSVAMKLGLVDPDFNVEEFGTKVLTAREDGMIIDDMDPRSYIDAYETIDSAALDETRVNKFTPDEKNLAATEMLTGMLVQTYPGIDKILCLLNNNGKLNELLSADRISKYAELNMNFSDIAAYWKGEIKNKNEIQRVENTLKEAEKSITPSLSDKEIADITNDQYGYIN